MKLSNVRTKPAPADLLVAAAIVILAVLCGFRVWLPQGGSGALTAVVTIDGQEADRFPVSRAAAVMLAAISRWTVVVSAAVRPRLLVRM